MNGPPSDARPDRRSQKARGGSRRRWPDRYRILEDRRPIFLRATDLKMRRDVVIRVRAKESAKAALRRETWVLERASRSNPNVPRVFDRWTDDEHEHLVLEYVAGKGLDELLQEGRAESKPYFAPEVSHRMVLGLIKGLLALHRNGVCHGDLKPANLIVVRNKLVMIDFGSAWSGAVPPGGRDRGTEGYASPEQWREEQLVDARADQFSVSAILYTMLTNELPWDGLGGSVVKYIEGPIPRVTPPSRHEAVRDRAAFFWPALDSVVEKGLAIDKDERFETTSAWLKAFEAARPNRDEHRSHDVKGVAVRELWSRLFGWFRSK